jgi:hypothetical protein
MIVQLTGAWLRFLCTAVDQNMTERLFFWKYWDVFGQDLPGGDLPV